MTWKPDFDPLTETARTRLLVSFNTSVAVREIKRPGETDSDVVWRLLKVYRELEQVTKRHLTSRQASRLLQRVREIMHGQGDSK